MQVKKSLGEPIWSSARGRKATPLPPPPIFEFITNAFLLFDPTVLALVTCPMTNVYTVHTRYVYDFARPAGAVVNNINIE